MSTLSYANARFRERSQPRSGDDADQAEGRMWAACAYYPFDLIRGLRENTSGRLKEYVIRPVSAVGGIVVGTLAGLSDAPPVEAALFGAGVLIPGITGITYVDNRAGGRSVDDSIYNAGVCGINSATGLLAGYGLGKGLQHLLF